MVVFICMVLTGLFVLWLYDKLKGPK